MLSGARSQRYQPFPHSLILRGITGTKETVQRLHLEGVEGLSLKGAVRLDRGHWGLNPESLGSELSELTTRVSIPRVYLSLAQYLLLFLEGFILFIVE